MLPALLLAAASMVDWVPARWYSSDPRSLDLAKAPVNCLLLEEPQWNAAFVAAAQAKGLAVLAVVRRDEQVPRAKAMAFDGFVSHLALDSRPVIDLPARRGIRFDSASPVIGTSQGVWPGIEIEHGGAKTAAPTGSAWVNTNIGFLRYVRAATRAAFWMAITPPAGETRVLQAVAEAGVMGARWVIAVNPTSPEWSRVLEYAAFYELHAEWRTWKPRSQLAIVQDAASGALVTGNLLDMLSVMNTPVRAVPSRELSAAALDDTRVAVTLDPRAYSEQQRALLAKFGGRVIAGPKDWRMPLPDGERIVFDRKEYAQLEAIWPELQLAVARKNFGVRLFNVTGVLSDLRVSPDGKRTLLQLVNYTDYAVENVTAFVQGKFRRATLHAPGAAPRAVAVFDAPDGTGMEIETLGVAAAVVLEQ